MTWRIILLKVAIRCYRVHCAHKGMDMVSNNTQVGCGVATMLNWYQGAQRVPRKYSPHHDTTTTSLNR
ncbi:hypothetical protein GDO81_029672 [Engystomops pustulosus]|uniref:Secreted protein n=1 Tax=Engystomops pustulosus TaxID=76066 RepID=A0AAV6YWJ7_ENGPU|nr:hypothetical protein GDO81_029672 [Engystomops pustulosus]